MRILLESLDGWIFSVQAVVARQSTFMDHLLDDLVDMDAANSYTAKLQLSRIDGDTLAQVVFYLEARHRGFGDSLFSQELTETIFLDDNRDRLAELLVAADFLDIPDLFNLICRGICKTIKRTISSSDESCKAVLIGKILELSQTISIVDIWAKAGC